MAENFGGFQAPDSKAAEPQNDPGKDERISQHAHDILAVPRDTEFLQSFLRVDLGGESEEEAEEEEDQDKRSGWLRVLHKKKESEAGPKDDQSKTKDQSDGQKKKRPEKVQEHEGMLTGKKTTFSQLKHDLRERHGAEGAVSPPAPGADGSGELGAMDQRRMRKWRRRRRSHRSIEEVYTDKDRAAAVNLGSRDIKQSLKMKRKQDRSQALQIPEEADPNAMLALSRRQMKAGRVSVALGFVNKALELQPEDVEALVSRSRCHLAIGQPANALQDAEAALTIEPGYIRGIYQKAEALYQLGDFEHSLMFYHRGYRTRPEMECFRLGVQKAQEAIQNTIGKKGPMPSRGSSSHLNSNGNSVTYLKPAVHQNKEHKKNKKTSMAYQESPCSSSRSSRQLLVNG
ncbi:hypothetical protein J437_LFUL004804 [Ladona fulva]|uniref:Outer dynein arm-docking complex subunit 4 n=1 Tax=Ladona fulva TaxID=123851 RepID=A0A8K0NZR4_LADFU|nr:hypothetical protein J437_LFUL004804 [Ladona fulva]